MVVSLIYGGMFWGIFPVKPDISWESHLWGGISGLGLALLYRKPVIADQEDEVDEDDEANYMEEDEFEPDETQTRENE